MSGFIAGETGLEPWHTMWILHPRDGDVYVCPPPLTPSAFGGPDGESSGRYVRRVAAAKTYTCDLPKTVYNTCLYLTNNLV